MTRSSARFAFLIIWVLLALVPRAFADDALHESVIEELLQGS